MRAVLGEAHRKKLSSSYCCTSQLRRRLGGAETGLSAKKGFHLNADNRLVTSIGHQTTIREPSYAVA